MKNKIFKNMEWLILISAILLCVVGFFALYSATQNDDFGYLRKQLIWFAISLVIMVFMAMVDYNVWVKLSSIFYGISIVLLVAVLFTKEINGASSWFNIGAFSLQPAELAKVTVILFTATVIMRIQEKGKDEINVFWKLGIILLTVAIPIFLIILQPDFGTAAAYIVALVVMLFVAGIDKKYIIVAILILAVSLPLIYLFILPDHAKKRIDVFLNPESDPRGSGYNVLQSKIAIGAGELTRNGNFKWKSNTIGLFISKNNRLYLFSNRGRNGLYNISCSYTYICNINYKITLCGKNCKR